MQRELQLHKACSFIADMDRGKIHNCISSNHNCQWNGTSRRWVNGRQRFEGTKCLHLHGSIRTTGPMTLRNVRNHPPSDVVPSSRPNSQLHRCEKLRAGKLQLPGSQCTHISRVISCYTEPQAAFSFATLVVTIYTARFNIQLFYVLPTECIYVFCVDLRQTADYFPIPH